MNEPHCSLSHLRWVAFPRSHDTILSNFNVSGKAGAIHYDLIEELVELGLDGIEYHHESHGPLDYERVRRLADRFDLFITGGSDDHGTFGSYHEMGSFQAPIGVIEKLAPTLPRSPVGRDEEIDRLSASLLPIVHEAADLVRRGVLARGPARSKSADHRDLVTEYDIAVEQLIVKRLGELYPDHAFVTEEETGMPATLDSPTWIIDPIDGTTNFAMMGRDFAICVGHYRGGRAVLGIVYDVMADDPYIAALGAGAWLNGARLNANRDAAELSGCILDASVNSIYLAKQKYDADIAALAPRVKGLRDYGSSAISLCRVATGQLDAYVSMKIALWDYAAAAHIVQEAGGSVLIGPALTDGEDSIRARHLVVAAGSPDVAWELARYIVGDVADSLFTPLTR